MARVSVSRHQVNAALSPRALSSARSEGYTILEIFIVIAVIGIIAAMATPRFRDMVGRFRLNAASQQVASHLKMARMLAVSRHTYARLRVEEEDPNIVSAGDPHGAYRVELWECKTLQADGTCSESRFALCTFTWCLADNDFSYRVDLNDQYPGISLDADDVPVSPGIPNGDVPSVMFNSDGFIEHASEDFALDGNNQDITIRLVNKRTRGTFEGRRVSLDRAGNVDIRPCIGYGCL